MNPCSLHINKPREQQTYFHNYLFGWAVIVSTKVKLDVLFEQPHVTVFMWDSLCYMNEKDLSIASHTLHPRCCYSVTYRRSPVVGMPR